MRRFYGKVMSRRVLSFLQLTFILMAVGISVEGQPVFVKNISANSRNFTKSNQYVFYTSNDSLFRTDGTNAGTIFLKRGFSGFSNLTEFKNFLYFFTGKDAGSGQGFSQLWRSDGTSAGTIRLLNSAEYDLKMISLAGDYLYFTASEMSTGRELYRTNGTPTGTILVKDINPGAADAAIDTAVFIGNNVLFGATTQASGRELWRSNGTSAGTTMIKDINPGTGSGFVDSKVIQDNNLLYFVGNNAVTGPDPWISDGTAAGTRLVKDIPQWQVGPGIIEYKIINNGSVYFILSPPDFQGGIYQSEIWKTNGTPTSTYALKGIKQCLEGCGDTDAFHDFLIYKGAVYFFVRDPDHFDNMWVTDGTAEGTHGIWGIAANDEGGGLTFFEVINNHMVLTGVDHGQPHCFYRSDGTPFTRDVICFMSPQLPKAITKISNKVFFGNPDNNFQLSQSDGFTVETVAYIFDRSFAGTDQIIDFNGVALFSTRDTHPASTDRQRKLWLYDVNPPAENTFMVVNADTEKDIQPVREGDLIIKPKNTYITIRFKPAGTPGSVVFEHSNVVVRRENEAPYTIAGDSNGDYFPWVDAKPGSHRISATTYSEPGGKGTAGTKYTINFTIQEEAGSTECTATGTVVREQWSNVSGNKVSDIPVHTAPSSTSEVTSLHTGSIGTNYGARMRGYICVPVTGDYKFFISSNDHSSLFIGTEDPPSNKVLVNVAHVFGATEPDEWGKYPTQESQLMRLIGGKQYYFEVLHKQGAGTDHLTVAWQLPDGTVESPIPGSRLSPYTDGNIPSDVAITSPANGSQYFLPDDVTITAYASDQEADIKKVEFFADAEKIGEDLIAPYAFTWSVAQPGIYSLTAVAKDDLGGSTTSSPVEIFVSGKCEDGGGTITREFWRGVPGSRVSDIPMDSPPTSTNQLTRLEGPSDIGTNYATRIRGYVCPPTTGGFQFFISSNDQSELWLGTSDDPSTKRKIAYLTQAVNKGEFYAVQSQGSEIINLVQGKKYYIEVLHKQGAGTDHIAVAWMVPDEQRFEVIPGSSLWPYPAATQTLESSSSSVEDTQFAEISIFPNPAQTGDGALTISGYDGIRESIETNVQIMNMTGEVIFSETISCGGDCSAYLMNLNKQLVPGIYLVKLKTNKSTFSRRLLVK